MCPDLTVSSLYMALGGHPKETWETPAIDTWSDDDGKRARENPGMPLIFGAKVKHREAPHDETSPRSHGTESRSGQTIFWIEDFSTRRHP